MAQPSENRPESFQSSWVDKAASMAAFGAGGALGSVIAIPRMVGEIDRYTDRTKVVVYAQAAPEGSNSLAAEAARTMREQEVAIADAHVAYEGAPSNSQELLAELARTSGVYIFLPALLGAVAVEALSASMRWRRYRRRQIQEAVELTEASAPQIIDLRDGSKVHPLFRRSHS